MFFRRILVVFFVLVGLSLFSQRKEEDSLRQIVRSTSVDSVRFKALKALYNIYLTDNKIAPRKAIAEEVINLGKRTKDNYHLGVGYRLLADYYHNAGKNTLAFENFLVASSYLEKTNDHVALVTLYTNLGGVYYDVGEIKQAELYFKKAMLVLKKHNLKDIDSETNLNNNLGICAAIAGNRELAKYYFRGALEIWKSVRDSLSMGHSYNNLSLVFSEQEQLDSALFYSLKALALKLKFGPRREIVEGYNGTAVLYMKTGNNKLALEHLKKAEQNVDSTITSAVVMMLYNNFSSVYIRSKDYKNALAYKDKYAKAILKQSEENQTSVIQSLSKGFADSLLNANEMQIQELQITNQKTQLDADKQHKIFLSVGLVLVLLGGALFYNRYKITKKQKEIIEEQKHLVEEQKKEIVDSINYANKIQNAVLTDSSVWQSISAQHFILFKPKDIVSGDFYWAHQIKNKDIWAVADCTGHGVPGAFMSMLANSLLYEVVVEYKVVDPATVLSRVRTKLIAAFSRENNQQSDGMDIALCVYDRISGELEFAGANNNAILIRDGVIQELKGDKMPVGKYHGEEKPFTSTRIKLQSGDAIYLYTDGFADQFGGPQGKKFRYKKLDELLLSNHTKDMKTQGQILEDAHVKWKKDLVQTDDICVVGIRIA